MDDVKYNGITVYQKNQNGFLGGPHNLKIQVNGIHIQVEQCFTRKTTISSDNKQTLPELFGQYIKLDRLMMIFDGEFYPITEITTPENTPIPNLEEFLGNRISAYNTSPVFMGNHSTLLSPFSYIDDDMVEKWRQLDNELGIVHQMYLHNLSDNGFPADGKVAFMIECFEPLSELIHIRNPDFHNLWENKKPPTLKFCIDKVISYYGNDIFEKEYNTNKEYFLSSLVNSRVKIMHIKRNRPKNCFSDAESVLYMLKLSLLYRRIILELLQVDYFQYSDKLKESVNVYNRWANDGQSILDRFLEKGKSN